MFEVTSILKSKSMLFFLSFEHTQIFIYNYNLSFSFPFILVATENYHMCFLFLSISQ